MSQQIHQKWNYFVLNINVAQQEPQPSPEEARKAQGHTQPLFYTGPISEEYKEAEPPDPMEVQLQKTLEDLEGRDGVDRYIQRWTQIIIFLQRPNTIQDKLS